MTGTIINIVAVLAGGMLGTLFGGRLPEKYHQSVVAAIGVFVLGLGLQMFLKTQNALIVIGSLLVGGLLGEAIEIEEGLKRMGGWLEKRVMRDQAVPQSRFVRGFLAASLVFCVGPMAILGSIQDGLTGNYQTLAIKSVLDAFSALAFASSLGIGVAFSVLPLLAYQGGISLLAAQVQSVVSPAMMNEMSAVGGLILITLSLGSLLEIKPNLRPGNYLPALLIAPLAVWVLTLLVIK